MKKYSKQTRRLWSLSYPTMIAFALQSVYDIVDMAWVGRISKEATAAVTIYSVAFWIFTVFNEVIGSSSVSMLSQAYGREDHEKLGRIAEQTLGFKTLVGMISALLLYIFLEPMMRIFSKDPEVIKLALDYGYIRTFFLPILFMSYSVNTIFRTTEDSKTPMYIMVLSTLINIVLDPILMFETIPATSLKGFNMGVYGAAVATVISISVSFIFAIFLLIRKEKTFKLSLRGIFSLDWSIDKDLLIIGLPSGVEVLFRYLSGAILLKFVTVYGTSAVSAAGIGMKVFGLAFMPVYGFMMGGSALVGKYLGQDDLEEAEAIGRVASYLNLLIMSLVVGLSFIYAQEIMKVFIDDRQVIEVGVDMIRYASPALIIGGFIFGRAVLFTGSGYNRPILVASIVARWLVQIPLLYLFVLVLDKNINYVWLTYLIAEVFDFIILYYYYLKGEWKYKRV